MGEWSPPILGFTNCAADITRVVWKDNTTVCGGILGDSTQLAATMADLAREKAERERKDELRRQPNVVLLEDWRRTDEPFREGPI